MQRSATDPDANDTKTYAITGDNADGLFDVGSDGKIKLVKELSEKTKSVYSLTVQVTDSGGLSDTGTVQVTITESFVLLSIDSDNDGDVSGADEADKRLGPGKIIRRNSDDDNANAVRDYSDNAQSVDGNGNPVLDDDLQPTTVSVIGAPPGSTLEKLLASLTSVLVNWWDSPFTNRYPPALRFLRCVFGFGTRCSCVLVDWGVVCALRMVGRRRRP